MLTDNISQLTWRMQAGINSMASLHVYSTTDATARPHEFSEDLEEVAALYGDSVIPKNGTIFLKDKPGLSIELNETQILKLKV